jgi:hypothetical protein
MGLGFRVKPGANGAALLTPCNWCVDPYRNEGSWARPTDRYRGGLRHGRQHGFGVYESGTREHGVVQTGIWTDGRMTGDGTLVSSTPYCVANAQMRAGAVVSGALRLLCCVHCVVDSEGGRSDVAVSSFQVRA